MNTVTYEAELDDGAPLVLVARTNTLIIVGDPRVVSADRLAGIAGQARAVMASCAFSPRTAAEMLAPHIQQLIKGDAIGLPPADLPSS
ncbi:hypothetical protein [Streptomyces rubellomurinus]|uniref:Uncharacterized protein n=1 Tax=Streptomyces rubellomurinus (strain ATCC 31215) TaxID=359131 RepID=A0A0F2TG36_STRR3|nr:hypothetical protein [Streptomyces rubellomurinus]KJS60672.1 hypothetical protein VM95_19870 [Streptomyces rubellomurinus]